MEHRDRPLGRYRQVCCIQTDHHMQITDVTSFAHVAVNAPEAYVKPTVVEKGGCTAPSHETTH